LKDNGLLSDQKRLRDGAIGFRRWEISLPMPEWNLSDSQHNMA
jgi:hypothetical protein